MSSNVELRYLDKDFYPVLISTSYETLIWKQSYTGPGEFQLITFEDLRDAVYIYNSQQNQLGVIEAYDDTEKKHRVYSGRMYKAVVADSVISSTEVFTNKPAEQIAYTLLTKYLQPNHNADLIQGYPLQTSLQTIQVTGDNLLEFVDTLLYSVGLTLQDSFNIQTNRPTLTITYGPNAIEEEQLRIDYGNLNSFNVSVNRTNYKNFFYIAGEIKEDGSRVIVTLDLRTDPTHGKKEAWIDARDLQSQIVVDGEIVQVQDYEGTLIARGLEKSLEYTTSEQMTADTDFPLALGEIRNIVVNGREYTLRVIERLIAYERNTIQVSYKYATIV